MTEICVDAPAKVRLSWSRLKSWEACNHRGKLVREGKSKTIRDGRIFLPGTLADRCMRRWLEQKTFEPGGMLTFLDELWAEHTGPDAEYAIKWKGNVIDESGRSVPDKRKVYDDVVNALNVLEPILMDFVVPFSFRPEMRFTAPLGIPGLDGNTVFIEIFGGVDVAVFDGTDYGLYDLKMTQNSGYISSTLAQLTFYAIAFKAYTGTWPRRHAFWTPMIENNPIYPIDVTETEVREMYARIIKYCHGVWRGQWPLTTNKNECFNCEVKHACPRWVTPITRTAQGRNKASFIRADFDEMQVEESAKSNEVLP